MVGELIRSARAEAGLSQRQLAGRLGTSQPAIARLERADANPTVATLERLLRAMGLRLEMAAAPASAGVDRGLIRQHLAASPADRLRGLETMYAEAQELTGAGASLRGRRP